MIKWIGSITGIIGALMLAMNNDLSKYGYIFFIISSMTLTYDFLRDRIQSMILNQAVYLTINIYGAYQWLI